MKYLVSYLDEDGISRQRTFEANAIDIDLGDVIMQWADEEYGVDSQTDGIDVWYDNGEEQVILMHITDIEENWT